MFINHSKELEVSKVVNDQDKMTDHPIPERKPEPGTIVNKIVGTKFHSFTFDDINILS